MNEKKEKKEINEFLLQNMTGVNPYGQPTHLTNKSKEVYHRKRTNIPKEEKSTHLSFPKEIITVFPVTIHFLLVERDRKMMTTSKENFKR